VCISIIYILGIAEVITLTATMREVLRGAGLLAFPFFPLFINLIDISKIISAYCEDLKSPTKKK
jgi:hypothetical protein